jgi:hypothetical protein
MLRHGEYSDQKPKNSWNNFGQEPMTHKAIAWIGKCAVDHPTVGKLMCV